MRDCLDKKRAIFPENRGEFYAPMVSRQPSDSMKAALCFPAGYVGNTG